MSRVPHCLINLKAIRLTAGVKPAELAKRLGITPATYYRYENGSRRIYFDQAVTLATTLGCKVEDFTKLVPDLPDGGTDDNWLRLVADNAQYQ